MISKIHKFKFFDMLNYLNYPLVKTIYLSDNKFNRWGHGSQTKFQKNKD